MSLSKSHIVNAANAGKRQVSFKVGARVVTQKVPGGTIRRYVDKAGNIVWVQLSDGSAPSKNSTPYRESIIRGGHYVRFGDCPVRSGEVSMDDVPKDIRHVCSAGQYSETKACPHVEWIIEERRKDYADRLKKRIRKTAAETERELRERELDVLREGQAKIAKLAELATGQKAPQK